MINHALKKNIDKGNSCPKVNFVFHMNFRMNIYNGEPKVSLCEYHTEPTQIKIIVSDL